MKRNEYIEVISNSGKITKKQAAVVLDSLIQVSQEALVAGDGINLAGFGSFRVISREGRPGKNPKTGEDILIKPRKTVSFRVSNNIKALLNKR